MQGGTMQGGGPLSPDEHRATSPSGLHPLPSSTIVVAIDRDRNSQLAVKWVVDHLLSGASHIILLHVAVHPLAANHGFAMAEATQGALEAEMREIFVPFRGFCTRNGVHVSEVVLEEADVSKAIIEFITTNKIQSIALGASNRNAFTKKFKNADVPSSLMKGAPDYCNIYVVARGKSVNVRLAKCGVPSVDFDGGDSIRSAAGGSYTRRSSRGKLPPATPEAARRSVDGRTVPELTTRPPFRERSISASSGRPVLLSGVRTDGGDGSYRSTNRSASNDSFAGDLDFGQSTRFSSMDFCDNLDVSSLATSPRETNSPHSTPQREVEVEMRRLRLELKQTMDMYNAACREAINAKQRTKELQLLKLEEARRLEEARHAEEAALAVAEMEKTKCRAAMEAAEAAQRLADLEAQRRRNAEVRARREADEKVRAIDAISSHDLRYRKYNIDEIELATERFSDALKIGEGGYGPVYRASLDHTPVAIKVLRPDAQQGRKQFQQEVEVLSCIRHPNMVLLLGACPDYGCLVYEYMDNGSLEDRLFRRGGTAPIPWTQRFRIAAEIATALLFLHQTKPEPLVHRDLKPANILLDRNYVSKISDVGLARLVPPAVADSVTQYRLTATAGTFCYIDPEYQQTGKLGVKSDIYSLGVLLLQVVTARPPMGLTHHVEKAVDAGTFAQMLDVTVKDWPVDEAIGFAKLALKCTEMRRRDRPDLATVILPELNRLRNLGHAYEQRMSGGPDGGAQAVEKVAAVSSPTAVGSSWRTAES
uniref:RING-type E3 ubiquitin transferase n=1 Tax=Leersia perrieri TaxID=77586 RepID=A0A0D9V296_9ORYZ